MIIFTSIPRKLPNLNTSHNY